MMVEEALEDLDDWEEWEEWELGFSRTKSGRKLQAASRSGLAWSGLVPYGTMAFRHPAGVRGLLVLVVLQWVVNYSMRNAPTHLSRITGPGQAISRMGKCDPGTCRLISRSNTFLRRGPV